jgi:hypothetical protein
LDAADPKSVAAMDATLRHEQADGCWAYIGGEDTTHAWRGEIIEGLLALGWEVGTIWVPWPPSSNGRIDGGIAATITKSYGLSVAAIDVEANMVGLPSTHGYCAAWRAAVKAAGLVTAGYSNASGIRAHLLDYDRTWCDTQGEGCETALCPGRPGSRAVQCGSGSWAGVSYDVTISEYRLTAKPAFPDPSAGGGMLALNLAGGPHLFFVGTDHNLYHLAAASSNDLAGSGAAEADLTTGTVLHAACQPQMVAGFESSGYISLFATHSTDGRVYLLILKDDGEVVEGWQPVSKAQAALVVGPKGDKGDPGPNIDEMLRQYLRGAPA